MTHPDNHAGHSEARATAAYHSFFNICSGLACLVGMGAYLFLAGVAWRIDGSMASAGDWRLIAAGGLISLAVAPLIPPKVAVYLGVRRLRLRTAAAGDIALLWTTLGAFALLAGLAAILLPGWVENVDACHRALAERFLWPRAALTAISLIAACVGVAPVTVPLGIALSCLHRLSADGRGWRVSSLGWALIGAGMGAASAEAFMLRGLPGHTLSLIGAVPVLTVAALSAQRAGGGRSRSAAGPQADDAALPDLYDHSPLLIRFVAAWFAVAAAVVTVVWARLTIECSDAATDSVPTIGTLLAAAAGVGIIACEKFKARRVPGVSGMGLAGALGGLSIAVSTVLPVIWLAFAATGRLPLPVLLVCAALAAGTCGYVMAYGQIQVLCRVGSPSATGASLLSVCLAAGSLALLALRADAGAATNSFGQLAAIALSLVAVGGTVLIHEPGLSARTRRWRLAVVGACVLAMIYVLPMAGRHWAGLPDRGRAVTRHTLNPAPQAHPSGTALTAAVP